MLGDPGLKKDTVMSRSLIKKGNKTSVSFSWCMNYNKYFGGPFAFHNPAGCQMVKSFLGTKGCFCLCGVLNLSVVFYS